MDFDGFIAKLREVIGDEKIIVAAGGESARADCPCCSAARGLVVNKEGPTVRPYCFGGCKLEDIAKTLGIPKAEFQPGCTLARFAEKTKLPASWLADMGISEKKPSNLPALVAFPYYNEDGDFLGEHQRIAVEGKHKFLWGKRSKVKGNFYGAEFLAGFDPAEVHVVEGESDTLTLKFNGFQAVGLPGASMLDLDRLRAELGHFEKIFFAIELDRGGQAILDKLRRLPDGELREKIFLVTTSPHKDTNDLYRADQENFKTEFKQRKQVAKALAEMLTVEEEKARGIHRQKAEDIISNRDILAQFAKELAEAGFVGEVRNAKLLYLALTTRHRQKPVSVVVDGPSAVGKNFLSRTVLRCFPAESYYEFTSMSERALIYFEQPLSHRFVYIEEAPGFDNEFLSMVLRCLLSENKISYITVEKDEFGKQHSVTKEVQGPTGLLTTTTRFSLHPENETRLQKLHVDDSWDQTAAVIEENFEKSEREYRFDYERWHAFQEWLAGAALEATIPFRRAIYRGISHGPVRLRRDSNVIDEFVKVHALIHQANRKLDPRGRVVAELRDYEVIFGLYHDLIATQAATGATAKDVSFLNEIRPHLADDDGGRYATVNLIAAKTKRDPQAVRRSLHRLVRSGYLGKAEGKKFNEKRFYLAENQPAAAEPILPSPFEVEAAMASFTQPDPGAGDNLGADPRDPPPPDGEDGDELAL